MQNIDERIARILPDVIELRRDLHAHPELAFEEHRTADRVFAELKKIDGLSIRRSVAGTGLVALLNEGKGGSCVALRADMDGLPIEEETRLPYASKNPGKMHACGHDGHMSCLIGAAKVLTEICERLPGPVKFIFQPAEEDGAGANEMCKAGVLDSPRVDAIFALHGCPQLDLGRIAVGTGPVHAATNPFEIIVRGKGAHGASPHLGVDPIVTAAAILSALQTTVSRTVDPLAAAVVTIGQIRGGTAINVIPDTCTLAGTIRTLDADVRRTVVQRVGEVAEHVAKAHGANADVNIIEGYPVAANDASCAAYVAEVGKWILGDEKVRTDLRPSMGAEDFAYYAQRIPAAIFRLGIRPVGAADYPKLHTPLMDFNDDALPHGIAMFCRIAAAYEPENTPAASP